MRHLKRGRKFSRVKKTRRALMKSVLRSFVEYDRIETTLDRAKEVRIIAEKLITKAKRGDLRAQRELMLWLNSPQTAKMIKIASVLKDRQGGYTRIIRTRSRADDGAEMAILEFVEQNDKDAE